MSGKPDFLSPIESLADLSARLLASQQRVAALEQQLAQAQVERAEGLARIAELERQAKGGAR